MVQAVQVRTVTYCLHGYVFLTISKSSKYFFYFCIAIRQSAALVYVTKNVIDVTIDWLFVCLIDWLIDRGSAKAQKIQDREK